MSLPISQKTMNHHSGLPESSPVFTLPLRQGLERFFFSPGYAIAVCPPKRSKKEEERKPGVKVACFEFQCLFFLILILLDRGECACPFFLSLVSGLSHTLLACLIDGWYKVTCKYLYVAHTTLSLLPPMAFCPKVELIFPRKTWLLR